MTDLVTPGHSDNDDDERIPEDGYLLLPDGKYLRTHKRSQCVPPCALHAPSDHPLKNAPLDWIDEMGQLYRICTHTDYHPDPDDMKVRLDPKRGQHRCCVARCCDTKQTIDGAIVTKTLELVDKKET